VLRAAGRAGFDPNKFLDQNGTLCIVTPNAESERFAPYFTALLSAVIRDAEARAADFGGPLEPRLLLALDETGNVFRYSRLPHLLTTARGNGIQLLLIYHDLAQVEHLYGGREVARTVVSNARMRILLPGVGDLETLRYWERANGADSPPISGHDDRGRRTSQPLSPLHRLQQLPTARPCSYIRTSRLHASASCPGRPTAASGPRQVISMTSKTNTEPLARQLMDQAQLLARLRHDVANWRAKPATCTPTCSRGWTTSV
jgi:hypothetical protein